MIALKRSIEGQTTAVKCITGSKSAMIVFGLKSRLNIEHLLAKTRNTYSCVLDNFVDSKENFTYAFILISV